jgi:hypothetical protein
MQVQPNSAAPQVTGAIRQAANTTGTSFDYLLATAQIESRLNPSAQAPTSSAKGLFQFIDQTWLATVKRAGAALGLGRFSQAIVQGEDGRFDVPDAGARQAIMGLRSNATVSALMAGAYTRDNAAHLTEGLGRAPSEAELYIAHFLGAEGATRLIGTAATMPRTEAAPLFPAAAGANRPIFFDRSGRPRSVLDVYRLLTGRYETARAGATAVPPPAVAAVAGPLRGTIPGTNPSTRTVSAPVPVTTASLAPAPDTAGVASAYADAGNDLPPTADTRPLFQSMFQPRPRQGVSPVVTNLWSPGQAAADNAARALDLFTDTRPAVRKLFGNGA